MEEKARLAELFVAVELVVRARPHRKRPEQLIERVPDGVGVGIGTEVAGSLALLASHHLRARPLVTERHREIRVALVVDQPHVETRTVLLDQVVFQHQGFDVVADLNPLD